MEQAEIEAGIEAYKPFRYLIAVIKIRCRAFLYAISALLAARWLRKDPRPALHHHYHENEGGFGYAERVVPPLFALSPFFSEVP
jgi:hypothetical protein